MFSVATVRERLARFVCVKIDPRDRARYATVSQFKGTGFVPEVVMLSADGRVISRLEARDPESAARELDTALEKARAWAGR